MSTDIDNLAYALTKIVNDFARGNLAVMQDVSVRGNKRWYLKQLTDGQ